jgi:hypothetical protein
VRQLHKTQAIDIPTMLRNVSSPINLYALHKEPCTDRFAVYSTFLVGAMELFMSIRNTEEPEIRPLQIIWINVSFGSEEDRNV